MAIREGRCPNCGSLVQGNTEKENYCIFCWAPYSADEAAQLLENSEGHHFPMLPQPEPDEELRSQALAHYTHGSQAQAKPRKTTSAKPVQRKKESKLSPAEQVAKMNAPVPHVEVDRKTLLRVLAGVAVLVIAFCAFAIPTGISQKSHAKELRASLEKVLPQGCQFHIQGMRNQRLNLVVAEALDEKKAQEIHALFQKVYATSYGEDSVERAVSRIYSEGVSFEVQGDHLEQLP